MSLTTVLVRGPTRFSGACSASIRPHLIKSRFFNPPPPPAIKPELRGNENSFVAAVHHSPRAGLHVARAGSAGRRSAPGAPAGLKRRCGGKSCRESSRERNLCCRELPLATGTAAQGNGCGESSLATVAGVAREPPKGINHLTLEPLLLPGRHCRGTATS